MTDFEDKPSDYVDPKEYGWVPKGSIFKEQTPDEKFKILSRVGDDYDNSGIVRQKRPEPNPFSSKNPTPNNLGKQLGEE